jgi:hypothetical protein
MKLLDEHCIDNGLVTDTMKWVCFSEELITQEERVFLLFAMGKNWGEMVNKHEGLKKLKDLLGRMNLDEGCKGDCGDCKGGE